MNNENENQKVDAERDLEQSNELVITNPTSLSTTTDDFSTIRGAVEQLENMKKLAEVYITGGLSPIKSVGDFVIAVITGNQLGLPFTISINNIFPINGKPAMSVHLIRALLLKAGITFEKTKDMSPVHQYYLTVEKDGKREVKKDGGGNPILGGLDLYENINKDIYMVNPKPSNKVTEYVFTRMIRQIDGSYFKQRAKGSFSIQESINAGLSEKDNYKNYPARMLDARAFMIGAREIAADIIFGLYSVNELADANNIKYNIDESMNETIIEAEIIR